MRVDSKIRQCLYLNWALPTESLPPPPAPLRYEIHEADGRSFVFVSALLFRQHRAHLRALPFVRISFPQLNLRAYVLDGESVPSVYFLRMFVPSWARLPVQLVARQPVSRARFSYPEQSSKGPWEWKIHQQGSLHCRAEPSSPMATKLPDLGAWETTVNCFRQRNRGYVLIGEELRRIQTEQPPVEVVPVRAELFATDLLLHAVAATDDWPSLHSAFLCPEISLRVELSTESRPTLTRRAPAPG